MQLELISFLRWFLYIFVEPIFCPEIINRIIYDAISSGRYLVNKKISIKICNALMDMEICLQKFCVFFNIIRWLCQNHNEFKLAINSAILFSILPITSYFTCFERHVYIRERDDVINFMPIPV